MVTVADRESADVEYLTVEQGWALLDKHAQRYLQMSRREFVERWDRGEIEDPDRPEVNRVSMLLPFVR
jgi:hypothetical protein